MARLIGMIGGMSWESSALYYRLLNETVHRRLGRQHNARSLLFTLDFDELDQAAGQGNWLLVADRVADAARRLERAGAEIVMITSVTGHIVYDQVQRAIGVPLLHIVDSIAGDVRRGSRVGLLGTRFTMTGQHLIGPLEQRYGVEIITPAAAARDALQHIISDELQQGRVEAGSQAAVRAMAASLGEQGAEAVIIGCTELPMLMGAAAYPVPALDLVRLHVEAAADFSLADR